MVSGFCACLHILKRTADQRARAAGCIGRFAGQASDLIGYDRESLTRGTGPGSFDSGIQRKDIRLKSDIFDRLYNAADLG